MGRSISKVKNNVRTLLIRRQPESIISGSQTEITLRMCADRTYIRSGRADHYVPAVAALPDGIPFSCENKLPLDIGEKFLVALLVMFLYLGDHLEEGCNLIKAFLTGRLGKRRVHLRPLVVLARRSISKISLSVRDCTAMEKLEPDLGVLFLVVSRGFEQLPYLDIAVFLCLGSIISVLVSSLALTGIRRSQIGLGLRTFKRFHDTCVFIVTAKVTLIFIYLAKFPDMADNYLEKKYDEYLHGKNIIRRANPSLDSLLSRVSGQQEQTAPDYRVKQAQLDAVIRSAERLGLDAEFSSDEGRGLVSIRCSTPEDLGALVLAARLKAAELGLHSRPALQKHEGQAEITIFR